MHLKKMLLVLCIGTFLATVGCAGNVVETNVEEVVISDTAAEALLMDVEGLEDIEDVDKLIEELAYLEVSEVNDEENVETNEASVSESNMETSELVEEKPVEAEEPSLDSGETEVAIINEAVETTENREHAQKETYTGKIERLSRNGMMLQIVEIQKLDRTALEAMTPIERKKTIGESIVYTGVYKRFIVNDDTVVVLNRQKVSLNDLQVGQFVQVVVRADDTAVRITGINVKSTQ